MSCPHKTRATVTLAACDSVTFKVASLPVHHPLLRALKRVAVFCRSHTMARPWHARALSIARTSALAALTILLVLWAPASTEGVSTKVRAVDVCHVHTWSTCIPLSLVLSERQRTSPLGGAPQTLAWLLVLRPIGCCANAGLVQPKVSAWRRSEEREGRADLATTKSGTWLSCCNGYQRFSLSQTII